MADTNLSLWESVCKTDPEFTKKNTQAGQKQTSIDAYYIFRKATKVFGPVGIGWGYEILEERYDSGALMGDTDQMSLTHTIKLQLWYKMGDQTGHVTQFGHTQFRYYSRKNQYVIIDEEAPKKSVTDAIKKCLSMLGFGGDVFMGKFDDVEYVSEASTAAAIEKAENSVEAEFKEFNEFREEFKKVMEQINNAVNENMVRKLYAVMKKKIEMRLTKDPKAESLLEDLQKAAIESANKFKQEEAKNDKTI